ncbi:MAG: hypothetical protein GF330_10450 [Candidatus Eisenbacteria bacterium]|nr:hypothetical protein [Candidatus Eisenbacteria bacterium]
MMPLLGRRIAALALLLAGVAACAQIAPPGGGPEDRDAPRVVAQAPDSGARRVAAEQPLRLVFSEPMNRSAVQDWLLIAPWPGKLEFTWREDTLTCRPAQGWEARTTYAVLLGVGASDQRGNGLQAPLVFAFATGDSLADGSLAGEVHTASLPRGGVPLFLFPWPDTLTPPLAAEASVRPEPREALRLAQTREDGQFSIPFVPRDTRLLLAALHDRNGNRAFDAGEDLWGFAAEPLICPDTSRAPVPVDLYLVYADEPGWIRGEVDDPLCRGYRPPRAYRAEIDTLQGILEGRLDPSGFAPVEGESGATVGLTVGERESLQVRIAELSERGETAAAESLRCDGPIWVRVQAAEADTLVAESRTRGSFEISAVPPGIYRLRAFRDANGNGVRDAGERSAPFPFPLEVRPGREVGGADWSLPGADSSIVEGD